MDDVFQVDVIMGNLVGAGRLANALCPYLFCVLHIRCHIKLNDDTDDSR